jgi:peptidoglycan-associated lipoprotein
MSGFIIFRTGVLRAGLPALALSVAVLASGCVSVGGIGSQDVTNAPAPGFERVTRGSEEEFIINVGRRTYFPEGSAVLDDTAKRTLDTQAAWLAGHGGWYIKLQGHADDPGSPDQNRDLSQRRADAVMAYLASKGVEPSRMWAKGYARERLVRNCSEIECKAQNRRVVSNLRKSKDESVDD